MPYNKHGFARHNATPVERKIYQAWYQLKRRTADRGKSYESSWFDAVDGLDNFLKDVPVPFSDASEKYLLRLIDRDKGAVRRNVVWTRAGDPVSQRVRTFKAGKGQKRVAFIRGVPNPEFTLADNEVFSNGATKHLFKGLAGNGIDKENAYDWVQALTIAADTLEEKVVPAAYDKLLKVIQQYETAHAALEKWAERMRNHNSGKKVVSEEKYAMAKRKYEESLAARKKLAAEKDEAGKEYTRLQRHADHARAFALSKIDPWRKGKTQW